MNLKKKLLLLLFQLLDISDSPILLMAKASPTSYEGGGPLPKLDPIKNGSGFVLLLSSNNNI